MHIQNEISISATPDKVWKSFTDQSLLPEWVCGFKSIKTISGEPLKPGSKHEMTILEKGKELKMIETVTHVVPGEVYEFTVSHDMMSTFNAVEINSIEGKTILSQNVKFKPHSWMMKLVLPLMKSTLKKNTQKDLEKLKTIIEARS